MSTALIGYTGFVGSSLLKQTSFDELYNSKNIQEIDGMKFSLVICAGAPAVKWKANQEPEQDFANIQKLTEHLKKIDAEEFILISTVDVYKYPKEVDENTQINAAELEPYGKHRYYLEQFVQENFKKFTIIRLPGLFGAGLKKNIIFDLMNNNCLHLTHHQSVFQFYDMSRLWNDIQTVRHENLSLINFATEPVSAHEIAQSCFGIDFKTITDKTPVNYNMKSIYSYFFNKDSEYMITKDQVFGGIRSFTRLENENSETSNF
ncbi:NAD-dependent epimerase/dehydratase family protein [Paenibacillus whitsoniae]|uniref:NAD(P)-dependent oxidoreductase n=1 Tax=Paenibacillus whitsoniae TaxID=2496558 RepID=A0A3S0AN01_9BACL|nr:NAD-dependent epimerase/dehydratase family protein [Paenibacillus whitsoniae]RTE08157.1 NAD(P)-dependent oxidoreductase [Paenibacillus whitsoniae]